MADAQAISLADTDHRSCWLIGSEGNTHLYSYQHGSTLTANATTVIATQTGRMVRHTKVLRSGVQTLNGGGTIAIDTRESAMAYLTLNVTTAAFDLQADQRVNVGAAYSRLLDSVGDWRSSSYIVSTSDQARLDAIGDANAQYDLPVGVYAIDLQTVGDELRLQLPGAGVIEVGYALKRYAGPTGNSGSGGSSIVQAVPDSGVLSWFGVSGPEQYRRYLSVTNFDGVTKWLDVTVDLPVTVSAPTLANLKRTQWGRLEIQAGAAKDQASFGPIPIESDEIGFVLGATDEDITAVTIALISPTSRGPHLMTADELQRGDGTHPLVKDLQLSSSSIVLPTIPAGEYIDITLNPDARFVLDVQIDQVAAGSAYLEYRQ